MSPQEHNAGRLPGPRLWAAAAALLLVATARCASSGPAKSPSGEVVLRVGVGDVAATNALAGMRALIQNLTGEGLVRIADDGRAEPRLADGWKLSADRLTLTVSLRHGTIFHDHSPVNASAISAALSNRLPRFMGPTFDDVDRIMATGEDEVQIQLKRPAPFLQEALELQVRKPGQPDTGTGPFMVGNSREPNQLTANANYYLGRPTIDRVVVTAFPSVRASWADLLRDRIDMLYELNPETIEFLKDSSTVSVFSFTRPYQYVVVLNSRVPPLRSAAVRRALNAAIDRKALVRDALDGHGLPSSGPVWPHHWALGTNSPGFSYDPVAIDRDLATLPKTGDIKGRVHFTCLVQSDAERLGLVVKRQLELAGIDMDLQEVPSDQVAKALGNPSVDAVLLDVVSGPSIFRDYQIWHSRGALNLGLAGNAHLDAAFDRVRHAASDDDYRAAVQELQKTIVDDPPAIFLAWSERSRAVNRRFDVGGDTGVDVMTTLRLWKPSANPAFARRN